MQPALSKADYQQLREQLTFTRRMWPTLCIMLADLALIAFAISIIPRDWPSAAGDYVAYIASQLILVVVFFHNFAILHECGHGNCSANDRVNHVLGTYASFFCFMPFFPWKYIHAEHHTWAGNVERDPTLALIRNYEESQKAKNWVIRFAWRTWLPLLAFFQHIVLWRYPISCMLSGKYTGRRLIASTGSIVFLAASYTLAAFLMPTFFNAYMLGPAVVIYLAVVELINFPHHMGTKLFGMAEDHHDKLPLWEQDEVTRSCYYPSFISKLLLLNFNFHIEHHLFPDLPWYNLISARQLTVRSLGDRYQESHGAEWSVENRSKTASEVFLNHKQTASST